MLPSFSVYSINVIVNCINCIIFESSEKAASACMLSVSLVL